MDRGGARVLKTADHVHDIERFAMSGIAVDKQRQTRRASHLPDEEAHLFDRDDPEVGEAHGTGHRTAADIDRVETGAFGEE